MFLLGRIFNEHGDGRRMLFGSRMLNWHGKFFLGSPERFGLEDVSPELKGSFWKLKADRILPAANDADGLVAWRVDSILVNAVRRYHRPVIALRIFPVSAALVLAFCFAGVAVQKLRPTQPFTLAIPGMPVAAIQPDCEELRTALRQKLITLDEIPLATRQQCSKAGK